MNGHITGEVGDIYWHYEVPRRTEAKVYLLTVGRVAVTGNWSGRLGQFYIAWSPMPKRNKALEDQLIERGIIPR